MNSLKTLISLFAESLKYPLTSGQRIIIFWNLVVLHLKSKFAKSSTSEISQRLHGFTVCAYDYPSLINLYTEIFLKQVYQVHLAQQKPFIIDCGANIGVSVLFFKKRDPESVIWAFEPNPNSFHLLKKNVLQNRLQDVTLYNCALSSVNGRSKFFIPLNKNSLNGSSRAGLNEGYETTVEARKLSDLVGDVKPDFVKMDIEGDEVIVIKDLIDHGRLTSINEFIIEYHPKVGSIRLEEFLNYFTDAKFFYQIVSEDPHSNVILHFYRDLDFLKIK